MASRLVLRVGGLPMPAELVSAGETARADFERVRSEAGVHLLLEGDRDFLVRLEPPVPAEAPSLLRRGRRVQVAFPWRWPVNRRLAAVSGLERAPAPAPAMPAVDLTGRGTLFLLADGRLSPTAGAPPVGLALHDTLIAAARWISSRRTSTFARLFPPSAFHPDLPDRLDRLEASQAPGLVAQMRDALAAAGASTDDAAARLRSAALTVLSHVVATVKDDPAFRAPADEAAALMFGVAEGDAGGRSALRAHAIHLLQMRAPHLRLADRDRATALVRGLLRAAPPYAELKGAWNFAMCSAWDFHEGEVEILKKKFRFTEIAAPAETPEAPYGAKYHALQAPFTNPQGEPVRVFARSANPRDENHEMGHAFFVGMLINRHAQLGSFDMQASQTTVRQDGYKLMVNSQCAGLTTRFAISRAFPDADIYSSWDSTYFRTGDGHKVVASEGLDCFVAILEGMAKGETHTQLDARARKAQWYHSQSSTPGFSQFVGPAHPLVVARYSDVNHDGRADYYDGYLDFDLRAIAEDLETSATPRHPGVAASQISGDAARGLGWAAGSLNRVTQYSDLWAALPGKSELLYRFHAGGFYAPETPPHDVATGPNAPAEDPGHLPAVCRYVRGTEDEFSVDVMFHAHLAHTAQELKRLLCAADAMWRAIDLGYLPARGPLADVAGQRGAVLLMLAGLVEYPADQNLIDGLWSTALKMLRFPPISRSVVRACNTDADHQQSNYYGSVRGLKQLMAEGGALHKADPVAWARLREPDPTIGRAAPVAPALVS